MASSNKQPSQEMPLYVSEGKIFTKKVSGYFQNLRRVSLLVLLGLYYLVPWLEWSGRQAVLFDLPARKFYIGGIVIWPQDFYLLTLLLILAGLSLFYFTALLGRVWCGFACPQTIWTDAFIWIERWVEGDRRDQIRLDNMAWTSIKIRKKALKHGLWLVFALFTGFTFVGYFYPITQLAGYLWSGESSFWPWFWVLFYGFATYGNAGFMREQVCKYMCPYARFQSAMFDKHTLVIAYDETRGEPRRGLSRNQNAAALPAGDCIDCGLCVAVCPTGIDIRDGLQYECIACAACIDVCDQVMEKIDRPKNLVKYATEATTKSTTKGMKAIFLRPRIIIYTVLLGIFFSGFITLLLTRNDISFDILRDRNSLYTLVGEQQVSNRYTLKVMNKSLKVQQYQYQVEGLADASIKVANNRAIGAGEVANIYIEITAPLDTKASSIGSQPVFVRLTTMQAEQPNSALEETRFFWPQ